MEFWFDFHSPWAYLAATRIEALATRYRLPVRWRPLHLPRLVAAIGGRRPLEESAAFVRWYRQDLQDWAARYGLTIRYHPDYPLRPARALRAVLFAETQGAAAAFALRIFRAYWTDGDDISDWAVLSRLGAEAGLSGTDVRAAADDAWTKDQLEANTAEAIEAGVFGVPTVDHAGKLYFGNDRLDLLDHHLALHGGTDHGSYRSKNHPVEKPMTNPPSTMQFGLDYAAAWSSGAPEAVASFFADGGEIVINGGEASQGREAIRSMAAGFYAAFPDLVVRCDDVRAAGRHVIFAWTLEGHHAETNNLVTIGGWEEWDMTTDGLIGASRGWFDQDDYDRQIAGKE